VDGISFTVHPWDVGSPDGSRVPAVRRALGSPSSSWWPPEALVSPHYERNRRGEGPPRPLLSAHRPEWSRDARLYFRRCKLWSAPDAVGRCERFPHVADRWGLYLNAEKRTFQRRETREQRRRRRNRRALCGRKTVQPAGSLSGFHRAPAGHLRRHARRPGLMALVPPRRVLAAAVLCAAEPAASQRAAG
jgi:hypothetical protein